jgi:CSLREA domain-containing protein
LSQSRIVLALLSFAIGSVWALGVALGVTIAPASAASSWVVNSTEDTAGDCTPSKCTLRAAIRAANLSVDADVITFDIPPAGPKAIVVGNGVNSGLPVITGSDVVIDATTQPGGGAHGIRLDDPDAGGGEHGLVLEGNRITIRGFAITRFDGWGILVWGGSSERIQGNWIGTADGVSDQGTGDDGIRLQGGGSSLIGGSGSGEGNLVSGSNNDGIEIRDSNDNVVSGNMVGLTANGLSRLPNASTGIEINATSSGNRVGGLSPGERNYVSGNDGIGVQILGLLQADGSCRAPEYNVVQGNYLGLDVNGGRMSPSGNRGEGVALHTCARHNTIGGTSAAARNIISGNAADGVELDSTGGPGGTLAVCDNVVQGNYIGLSPSGLGPRSNMDDGVGLDNGACNNLVGGTEAGARNYISGNHNDGVDIAHNGSNGNVVEGNVIGLGVDNTTIQNGWYGVMFRSKPQRNILRNNVISGNAQGGIRMQDYLTYYNEVRQNRIGTDITGTAARANKGHGIWLFDGPNENLLSGNTIMWNSGAGIAVERVSGSNYSTRKNRITNNSMRGNGGLGIDLLPNAGINPIDGVNNNSQIGNNGIDSPVITRATANGVRGSAPPNTSVEVYLANPDTGESNGEGSALIDSVAANASGEWCLPKSGLTGTVTATATDTAGNTSEFAANATVASDEAVCGATTAPTVSGVAPAEGAKDVAATANTEVTFSEAMDPNTISTSTFTLTKQGASQPLTSQVSYDAQAKKATLDPNADLEAGATYTATLKGGASGVKDLAGNPLAQDKAWSFTTVASPPQDTTPPETTIDAGPSGTVSSATATFSFSSNETNSIFECRLDSAVFSSCTSPKDYTDLSDGQHTFEVRARDGAGNTDTTPASRTWTVDTAAPADTTAPTVSGVTPQDGATSVALATNVEATFSEEMDASTINGTTFTLTKQGASQPLTSQVSYDAQAKKATLDPNADLEAGATYTATLKGGASGVKDLAGNPLAQDKAWSFTTKSDLLFADDFTGPDGSPPANWTVKRSAGGTAAGATIQENTLREDVILSPTQDGAFQYVQARANPIQPEWSTRPIDFMWQMHTEASTAQTIGLFLTPQALSTNVSNASDYLRVRVTNGQVSLVRRVGGGTPTTIWSGPITSGTTLRQFQLRLDGTNLWLYEGALGSSPALRVGPVAHGLGWSSGHLYLHAHNSSAATPYSARFDTVRIYDRG